NAHILEEAGCFSIVLEKIPAALASRVTKEIHIPTIGIGAGNGTDGQVLVLQDMLGITQQFKPRYLRTYGTFGEDISNAVRQYIDDVKSVDFPNEKEQY
ncbi:MAG: 3-methyl-2-oxobutanoate hydroxymethyltransferase, partial [Bacteroidales bacterium]|nr:3-methyl-2-oxobutanoate hydroxymethyltransferase [Bacteroidales bacterium]